MVQQTAIIDDVVRARLLNCSSYVYLLSPSIARRRRSKRNSRNNYGTRRGVLGNRCHILVRNVQTDSGLVLGAMRHRGFRAVDERRNALQRELLACI